MYGLLTGGASVPVIPVRAAVTGVVIVPQSSCFQGERGEDHRGYSKRGVARKCSGKGGPELGYTFQGHPGHAGGLVLLAARQKLIVVVVIARRCLVDCPDRHNRFPFCLYTLQQPTCYKLGCFISSKQSIIYEMCYFRD